MRQQGNITVERMTGPAAAQAEGAFRLVYAEAFAEPPDGETEDDVAAAFRRFRSQTRKRTFRAALARAEDGTPVGMAHGYPLGPHTGWWDQLTQPVPHDMRREDGHRTFGLMELAVRGPWRRQGVARRLHETVLDGTETERVLLNVHPTAARRRLPTGHGGTARWARLAHGKALPFMTSCSSTCAGLRRRTDERGRAATTHLRPAARHEEEPAGQPAGAVRS